MIKRIRKVNSLAVKYGKKPSAGRIAVVTAASLISAACLLFGVFYTNGQEGYAMVLATVNDIPICSGEFKQQLDKNRAATYSYFNKKYGADGSGKFWTSSYGGEIPLEFINNKTLKECISIKIQMQLAKENGILSDISYTTFMNMLEQENKRRREAVNKNSVIFGPKQFTESTYFEYLFSNTFNRLKEALSKKELAVSEDELSAYYDGFRDRLFKNQDSIRIDRFYFSYSNVGGSVDETCRKNAGELASILRKRLLEAEPVINAAIATANLKGAGFEEHKIDSSSIRGEAMMNPLLLQIASAMAAGDVSELFDEGRSYNVIRCTSREAGGYKQYNECRDIIRQRLVEEKYTRYINRLIGEAQVVINRKVLENIGVESN